MITLEITTKELIYLSKDSKVGELVKVFYGKDIYAQPVEKDECGRKYVSIPITQKIAVPNTTEIEKVAVYEDDKLLLRREIK